MSQPRWLRADPTDRQSKAGGGTLARLRRALAHRGRRGDDVDPLHPVARTGATRSFAHVGVVGAPAARVFPLLCPVLEYLWLDDWRARMIHTVSGVAEEGAVFRTWLRGREIWLTTRYEPPMRVSYAVFAGPVVMRLDIELSERQDGTTELCWRRSYTATTGLGRRLLGRMTREGIERELAVVHERLRSYLADGRPLAKREAEERLAGVRPPG